MARRVAIIGARGIGRHHANWWRLEGADVCAFAGTSPESVAQTQRILEESAGFRGRGYTDVAAMLRIERPEIVDVCSPAPCHAQHVRAALEAGCHVLCEKPFVYDPARSAEELLTEARRLLTLAENRGVALQICTQYTVAARIFRAYWNEHHSGEPLREYAPRLEAPAKDRGPDPERIWIDLSPHLFSVLLALFPDAIIDWDSLETRFEAYDASAAFRIAEPGQPPVQCRLHTRNRTEPPANIRRFRLNGRLFEVEADRDAQGVFCAAIHTPTGILREDDFMRQLIRAFLENPFRGDRPAILPNLEWMLAIRDAAVQKR